MKAFVYTGGAVRREGITEHPRGGDLAIAADAGYETAVALGERVDVLLGDFDSLAGRPEDLLRDTATEIIRVPTEKDDTDTQLAVEEAIRRGAEEIIIIGGLGGRLDHTLSTLAILEDLHARGVYATLTDGQSRVRYLRSSSTLIARSGYKYLSVLAADADIEGCKYPLKRATLRRERQFAVSNELTGNVAFVSVRRGGVFIIESSD